MSKKAIIRLCIFLLYSIGFAALLVFQKPVEEKLFDLLCKLPEKPVYAYAKTDQTMYYEEEGTEKKVKISEKTGKISFETTSRNHLFMISTEEKSIYYPEDFKDGENTFTLCRKKLWEDAASPGEQVLAGIKDYICLPDEKIIYQKGNELREKAGENDRKLAEGVSEWHCAEGSHDVLYVKGEGNVFLIKNGASEAKSIVQNAANLHIYPKEDSFFLYYTKGQQVTVNLKDLVMDTRKREDELRQSPDLRDYSYSSVQTDYFGRNKVVTYQDTSAYNQAEEEYQHKLARDEVRRQLDQEVSLDSVKLYAYDTSSGEKEIFSGNAGGFVFSRGTKPYARIIEMAEPENWPDVEQLAEDADALSNIQNGSVWQVNTYLASETQLSQLGEEEETISQAYLQKYKVLTEEGQEAFLDENGKMFYFQGEEGATELWCDSECVMQDVYDGYLKPAGDGVLYLCNYDKKAEKGNLCFYKDKKSKAIAENVDVTTIKTLDNMILYCTDYQDGKGGKLYVYDGEASYPVDTGVTAVIYGDD